MIKAIAAAMVCVGLVTSPLLPEAQKQPEVIDMGVFEITAYAEDGITATGTLPQPMRTCAVDPTVIPYGTKIYVEDLDLYLVAEDCGGAVKGEVIDVYMSGTEADTRYFGRQRHRIWILKED